MVLRSTLASRTLEGHFELIKRVPDHFYTVVYHGIFVVQ